MKNSGASSHHMIVMNATNIGSRASGISNYTLRLIEEFSRLNTGTPLILYLNRKAEERIRTVRFPENITVRWAPRFIAPDYQFIGHLLRLLYANYLFLRHPKVLIFNTSQIEAGFFRSRQVITVHDIIPLLFREHHKRQYFYFRYILNFALRFAQYVITPSSHTRELLQSIYGLPARKILVIPHGIQKFSHESDHRSTLDKENFILFVGRIGPMKNVSAVIRAFHSIRREIPYDLIIVGEGKEKLKDEINAGRLSEDEIDSDRIIIKGYLPEKEIVDYFRKASLFVFPSLYEGFGLPPLEAMSCGCPVLVSRIASLPEQCGEAAYYVDPQSVESIARGMLDILTDPGLRKNLARKGFHRAAAYCWGPAARKHLIVIREASSSWRRRPAIELEESSPTRKKRFGFKVPPTI